LSLSDIMEFESRFSCALGVLGTNPWVVQTPSSIAVTAAGPATLDTPRPADLMFERFGEYLAPHHPPKLSR
jgi:hypothetical protein